MKAVIKEIGNLNISDPIAGDMTLNLFPLKNYNGLPKQFETWDKDVKSILSMIPMDKGSSNEHYVTIDTKFFTQDETLRREGVHIDGNFCADPNFSGQTWGGTTIRETWAGAHFVGYDIVTPWLSPYGAKIPIGQYVSEDKGGIFCVSTEVGCQGWSQNYHGEIGSRGDFSGISEQLGHENKVLFEKNKLYFMTSNTPHETLLIKQGKRRTLVRITLAHDYPNKLILN